MSKRTSVVISQSQSSSPAKRQLEEEIVSALLFEPGIDVTIVPHLYDLKAGDTGLLALTSVSGNMVVCSWLFERATHWVLDRHVMRGQHGIVLLKNADEDEEDEDSEDSDKPTELEDAPPPKDRVVDSRAQPSRKIYCLDLRVSNKPVEFVDEIKRIHRENSVQIVGLGIGSPPKNKINSSASSETPVSSNGHSQDSNGTLNIFSKPTIVPPSSSPAGFIQINGSVTAEQMQRFETPTNDTALALDGSGLDVSAPATVSRVGETPDRRWYPVIDYSRCTNCMECIDFCLFGVYGVDKIETILVEQPDNCRKGCPACSRVCPENAIMFPQHKTPAIAGSNDLTAALKIDLSQLFGAPAENRSAVEVAAAERDEQLMLAGRSAVGLAVGIPKRHTEKPTTPRDSLDDLVDQLNSLDL